MPMRPDPEKIKERLRELEKKIASKKGIGSAYGLAKGMSVTLRTMLRPAVTQQYPHEKPDLPPRTRGVIALKEENCTVCMLCSRECPDWCIYIESHKDVMPPKTAGARPRTRNVLDRFAIDYALCMYCGICVEVCPFDALFWAPEFEYSTTDIAEMTHEMPKLAEWMSFVRIPPPLEDGAEAAVESGAEAVFHEPAGVAAVTSSAPQAEVAAAPVAQGAPAVESAPPAVEAAPEAAAAGQAPAAGDAVDHEPPQVDEETFQRELAAGKPERVARAMAKRAWVLKRRKGGG